MPQAAHLVAARSDGARGDVIDSVLRRLRVTQEIIAAVPPRDVFASGERRFADEIAHTLVLQIFDHERHESGFW